MKRKLTSLPTLAMLLGGLGLSHPASARAATNIWTGGSGADLFWSTAGNWSPAGLSGTADDVQFTNTATVLNAVTSNNIVSANTVARSLWYRQTNGGYHNTLINPGVTLTISNTAATSLLLVGSEKDGGAAYAFTNTISGAGGSLVVTDTNVNSSLAVRQPSATSGTHRATLDMSGLDNFSATVGRVQIAVQGSINRPAGTLLLAKTNVIVALGTQGSPLDHSPLPGITLGDGGNNGGNAIVQLGLTNALFTDSLVVGREKAPSSLLQFNPAFTNRSPTVYLRGQTANRIGYFAVGDNSGQQSVNTASTGTVDLRGGTVDAQVDSLFLGRGMNGPGGGTPLPCTGTLTFDKGILDVNTLEVGYQVSAQFAAATIGNLNVNGTATLLVNNSLRLARNPGSPALPVGTLNINGGTVAVAGDVVAGGGTSSLHVKSGVLDMFPAGDTAPGSISAQTITVGTNGVGTITNAGLITATTLVIGAGGSIGGATTIELGSAATLDGSALSGGFVLGASQTLRGSGAVTGPFTQSAASTLSPGGNGLAGTLTFSNNLTLGGGMLPLDLSASSASGNDQITAMGNLTLTGTNNVLLNALSGTLDTAAPYTVISHAGLLAGNATYLQVTGPLAQSRYAFTFDTTTTPSAVQLHVGGTGPATLKWVGGVAANAWDPNTTANWNNGVGADKFFNLDHVTFDDTGSATPAVNLVGTLLAGSITMQNSTKPYTFTGTGSLASGGLTHAGPGALTLANSGANSFRDTVSVTGGTLTFSNASQNTFSGGVMVTGGSAVFAGDSANDFSVGGLSVSAGATAIVANTGQNLFGALIPVEGTLFFSQSVNAAVDSPLSGSGTVIKAGTGTLALSADNTGLVVNPLIINAGILRVEADYSLPPMGAVLTAGAGTLDVNGLDLGTVPITFNGPGAGGLGAIVSNDGNPNYFNPNLNNVTLAGHTTFGGTGRWNIRSPGGVTGDPATATLSTSGQPFNLTKVGTNCVGITSVTVDAALADIDVQAGTLAFEGNNTSMGNPSKTLTMGAGTTLQLYQTTNLLNKNFMLHGNGTNTTILTASGTNAIVGPITLNGVCLFGGGGAYLTNAGSMSGSGSLVKLGGHTLVLAGFSAYTGSTTVSNGSLVVDGSLAGSGVAVNGGTLAGIGSISAPVVVNAGGTLSPAGDAIGTLTITASLVLGGTNRFDVTKTGTAFSNDLVQNVSSLTYGGTLQLVLTGDALVAGDSFKLFAAGSYAGAFTSIVPATPAAGLVWDTSKLSSGTLRVSPPIPVFNSVKLVGSDLILQGTGGLPGGSYSVMSSTNIVAPMAEWISVGTGTFGSAGDFSYTNAVSAGTPSQFFRLLQ